MGSLALRDEAPRADETAKKKSKEERRAAKAAASRAREQGADDAGTSAAGGDPSSPAASGCELLHGHLAGERHETSGKEHEGAELVVLHLLRRGER